MAPCLFICDEQYDIDDIILSEYGTTVVGLEMMRLVNEEMPKRFERFRLSSPQSAPCLSLSWKLLLIFLRS